MFRPGSGAARLVGLHGQPAHQEPLHQLTRRRDVTDGEFRGPRDSTAQRTLDEIPHPLVDGLDPQHVGKDPVGPGRDLAQQVAVTGGRHHLRRGGHHGQVGDAAARGRAAQRLFEPVEGDRGTESGVAVHGGRGADHQVGPAEFPGGPFRDVVERARADDDGDRIHRRQGIPQGLAVLVFRVQLGFPREDVRIHELHPRRIQGLGDPFPGQREGAFVRDHYRPCRPEQFREHLSGPLHGSLADHHGPGVGGVA